MIFGKTFNLRKIWKHATLPSKYDSWDGRPRRPISKIGLILAGIIGGIILLAAVSPKYIPINSFTDIPMEYNPKGMLSFLLYLFSILGVLLFLGHKFGVRVPAWRWRF